MDTLIVLIVLAVIAGALLVRHRNQQHQLAARTEEDLAKVRQTAEEDVTRYGEELQALDVDAAGRDLDEAARQDYQRALDCYEQAKESLDAVRKPEEIRHVTEVLESGRYAVACVQARLAGEPLPQRRPPCFFNPAHGPSATEVTWAPPGGHEREIPVCLADAERVQAGAEPDVRTVMNGPRRVPYWQGGPAYAPWAQGYYAAYPMQGLLPGLLIGSMMAGGFGGSGDDMSGFGDGGADAGAGADGGGDAGGFDGGGGDGGGFDFGGDGGGFDFGDFGF